LTIGDFDDVARHVAEKESGAGLLEQSSSSTRKAADHRNTPSYSDDDGM
jgi:hypothetical protein